MRKPCLGLLIAAVLSSAEAWTQTGGSTADGNATADQWAFLVSALGTLAPDDSYGTPEFAADRKRLHLEARYNYEDLQTGSLWIGYKLAAGHTVQLKVTPELGGVFGRTHGIAPGYEMSLEYKALELTSEGEQLFDLRASGNNFFYSWNELVYSPVDWFHTGLVSQTTRAYASPLDIQRGVSVGSARGDVDFTAYVFNLGWTKPTVVLELDYTFSVRGRSRKTGSRQGAR